MDNHARIQPYVHNPYYWQYRGKPVLLLGGSETDHLFLIENLKEHLDEMAEVGGNYVRNTMSQREASDLKPHRLLLDGTFNLDQWNDEYWERFQNLLVWTSEREIFVQIEVWDRFDFSKINWQQSPWNSKNNVNYTLEASGLNLDYPAHPGKDEQPFFHTVPEMGNNKLILGYQEAFVDRMLSYSLSYDHVLYCMDNETSTSAEWGGYWASYIQNKAKEKGKTVETTEMWDARELDAPCYSHTVEDATVFSFVEASQNNHNQNRAHWDNLRLIYDRVKLTGKPRPINCTKIYGANTSTYGRDRDGLERFWRNILGGAAGARFHRGPSGLGLNAKAKRHIRSARMFENALDIINCEPDQTLLGWHWHNRNDVYCIAQPGKEYGLFFTDGGMVVVNVSAVEEKDLTIRWLDISNSKWLPSVTADSEDGKIQLQTPDDGYWGAVIQPAN